MVACTSPGAFSACAISTHTCNSKPLFQTNVQERLVSGRSRGSTIDLRPLPIGSTTRPRSVIWLVPATRRDKTALSYKDSAASCVGRIFGAVAWFRHWQERHEQPSEWIDYAVHSVLLLPFVAHCVQAISCAFGVQLGEFPCTHSRWQQPLAERLSVC